MLFLVNNVNGNRKKTSQTVKTDEILKEKKKMPSLSTNQRSVILPFIDKHEKRISESHDGRNLAARAYCNLHSCYNFSFVLRVKIYSFLTNQVLHIEEM